VSYSVSMDTVYQIHTKIPFALMMKKQRFRLTVENLRLQIVAGMRMERIRVVLPMQTEVVEQV